MKTSPYEAFHTDPLRGVFGVMWWTRSYTNLLYLLLGFPLGLLYFVSLTVGFALGAGTLIIGVGVIILLVCILASYGLTLWERQLAIRLLGAPVPPVRAASAPPIGDGWPWLKSVLGGSVTWKGLVFLVLKFPLGTASWVAVIALVSVVGSLIAAPFVPLFGGEVNIFAWQADTLGETLAVSLIGLVLAIPALHLLNGLAYLWGRFACLMLGLGHETMLTSTARVEERALAPV